MVKQTAGRDALTGFADEFAHLNDDILFGEVWSREVQLSLKMRSILTVTVLVSKGLIDSSFQYHMQTAKKNGVTKAEMGEILTHVAFYAGWPNAWAAFRVALEVYKDDEGKDGGMFGRHSESLSKSTRMMRERTAACSVLESRTTPMHSTSSAGRISNH